MSTALEPTKSSSEIEEFDDAEWLVGMEDFDVSDAGIPRMKIVGDEGVFEDQSTNINYESITGVVLGFLKQRIMFDIGDGEDHPEPLCRSNDFKTGQPSVDFPIDESGVAVTMEQIEEGVKIACETCNLKEWGTSPDPKRETPWCSEQWVFVVLGKLDEDSDVLSPAIFTFKGSGIAASKKIVAQFHRAKKPMFSKHVTISLEQKKRGSVRYSTPVFELTGDTDRSDWPDYVENYQTVEAYLRSSRANEGSMTDVVITSKAENDHDGEFV